MQASKLRPRVGTPLHLLRLSLTSAAFIGDFSRARGLASSSEAPYLQ